MSATKIEFTEVNARSEEWVRSPAHCPTCGHDWTARRATSYSLHGEQHACLRCELLFWVVTEAVERVTEGDRERMRKLKAEFPLRVAAAFQPIASPAIGTTGWATGSPQIPRADPLTDILAELRALRQDLLAVSAELADLKKRWSASVRALGPITRSSPEAP